MLRYLAFYDAAFSSFESDYNFPLRATLCAQYNWLMIAVPRSLMEACLTLRPQTPLPLYRAET